MIQGVRVELALLALLSLLWGASYLFIKVAVKELPPVTLIAARVSGAALFLLFVLKVRSEGLPRGGRVWGMLGIQAIFNSIGAWTVLAWGQQFVDAGLASVLNSTSPVFVLLFLALWSRHERPGPVELAGVCLGILGVVLIVGVDIVYGLGEQVMGQGACLLGAALYASAAIYGKRFSGLSPAATATGTMIWASIVLVPAACVLEQPWSLSPGPATIAAALALSILSTGIALLVYFRLIRTIGSLGVASQSYLRAGVGVMLGVLVLGESPTLPMLAGLAMAILGVVLINWPFTWPFRRGAPAVATPAAATARPPQRR